MLGLVSVQMNMSMGVRGRMKTRMTKTTTWRMNLKGILEVGTKSRLRGIFT